VCDSGYYGQDTCVKCPNINIVLVVGSMVLDDCKCDAGYSHTVSNGVTVCELCAAGKYKMTASSNPCTLCEAGKYKVSTGQGSCTQCLSGQYSVAIGAISFSVCNVCDLGSYSTSLSVNACVQCPKEYPADTLTNAFDEGKMQYVCVDFLNVIAVQ